MDYLYVDHTYCCSSYGWVWPSALDWSAHERRPSCAPSHPECLASFRSIPIIRFIYSQTKNLTLRTEGRAGVGGARSSAPGSPCTIAHQHCSREDKNNHKNFVSLWFCTFKRDIVFFVFCFNVFATYLCSCSVHTWESTKSVAGEVNTVKSVDLSFHSHFLMSSVVKTRPSWMFITTFTTTNDNNDVDVNLNDAFPSTTSPWKCDSTCEET